MINEIETFEELYENLLDIHPNSEKTEDEGKMCIYLNDYYNKRISYWNDEEYCCAGYIIEVYSIASDDYVVFSENGKADVIFKRIKALL